jgi:hypothetical protein
MNDESKRIPGTLHRATQSACSHWAPIVPTAVEVLDTRNEALMPAPAEEPVAEPDISGI